MIVLTHARFVQRLKSGLTAVGFDSGQYSGHSFRRGGCTLGYRAGLNLTELKLRGDWKSQAFEKYLFVSASSIFKSACALSKCAAL